MPWNFKKDILIWYFLACVDKPPTNKACQDRLAHNLPMKNYGNVQNVHVLVHNYGDQTDPKSRTGDFNRTLVQFPVCDESVWHITPLNTGWVDIDITTNDLKYNEINLFILAILISSLDITAKMELSALPMSQCMTSYLARSP